MPATAGEMGDVAAGGGGETPMGFGFSPGQVEGPPTSLEVQLQEELVAAPSTDVLETAEREEESSRRETSTLDYRNVPSELSRAQQDLLNEDRIPREYRNLIREYFEAIQRDAGGSSEP